MDLRTAHALIRFGLGRRADEPPPGDPVLWLGGQLRIPDPAPPGLSTAESLDLLRQDRDDGAPPAESKARTNFRRESQAFLDYAVQAETPFRERLVWFWANHFAISVRALNVACSAGAYIREAIRPHVTGRFLDMLLAAIRHPAMLLYLNNVGSVGPHSRIAGSGRRGLNENLARECLELHTVTPAAGYTQADVTEFARVLTGWTADLRQPPLGFAFRPAMHDPGSKTVLGRAWPEGEQGGVQLLAFLADHPATHRNLATKLVRHFVADDPPPDAVRRIEGVLRDTHGDLGAAAAALIGLPQSWEPLTKLRSPQDHVVATLRATGLPEGGVNEPAILAGLGEPLWSPAFPNGFPDRAADWAGPEGLLRRVDWAYGFAGRMPSADPEAIAHNALGPLLSPATLDGIRHAGSRRDALTLVLSSPEFLRR